MTLMKRAKQNFFVSIHAIVNATQKISQKIGMFQNVVDAFIS